MKLKQIITMTFCYALMGTAMAQELNTLAQEFLNTLTPELQAKTIYTLNDEERFNFNYVPMDRKGTTFHDFNAEQKEAALELLKASISKEGYRKTKEIIALEKVLFAIDDSTTIMSTGFPRRDPLNYHFWIFGEPDTGDFWGWRFEGHHLSLNFVAEKGKIIASTPSFMGSNPAIVPSGEHKGKEVLKEEKNLGYALVRSLSKRQLAIARFSDTAPKEIFTSNQRSFSDIGHKGISYTALRKKQRKILIQLLNVYLGNYEAGYSEALRSKIEKAGIENLSFAWAGSLEVGKGHYYNIQGPTLLIEYDNTQTNANHVHTAVRDLTNDFAEDLLREHYKKHHN